MLYHTMLLKQQPLTVIAASNAVKCAASKAVHAMSDVSGFCTHTHTHTHLPYAVDVYRGVHICRRNNFVSKLTDSPVHLAAQVMVGASQPAGWQPGLGGLHQHSAWLLAQQLPAQLPSPQTLPAAHE